MSRISDTDSDTDSDLDPQSIGLMHKALSAIMEEILLDVSLIKKHLEAIENKQKILELSVISIRKDIADCNLALNTLAKKDKTSMLQEQLNALRKSVFNSS